MTKKSTFPIWSSPTNCRCSATGRRNWMKNWKKKYSKLRLNDILIVKYSTISIWMAKRVVEIVKILHKKYDVAIAPFTSMESSTNLNKMLRKKKTYFYERKFLSIKSIQLNCLAFAWNWTILASFLLILLGFPLISSFKARSSITMSWLNEIIVQQNAMKKHKMQ